MCSAVCYKTMCFIYNQDAVFFSVSYSTAHTNNTLPEEMRLKQRNIHPYNNVNVVGLRHGGFFQIPN